MAKYLIKTPNKNFSGSRFGLVFRDGQASTQDAVLARKLKMELGYSVQTLRAGKAEKSDEGAKKDVAGSKVLAK